MHTSPDHNDPDYGAAQYNFVPCAGQPGTARKAASHGLHLARILCRPQKCGEGDGRAHDQLPEDRETSLQALSTP